MVAKFNLLALTNSLLLVLLATTTGWVAAQANVPTCVLQCAQKYATSSGCTGLTDLKCLCNSETFFDATGKCVVQTCQASEVQTAQSDLKTICAGFATTSFSLNTASLSRTAAASGGGVGTQTVNTAALESSLLVLSSSLAVARASSLSRYLASLTATATGSNGAINTQAVLSSLSVRSTSLLGGTGALRNGTASSATASSASASAGAAAVVSTLNIVSFFAPTALLTVGGMLLGAMAVVL